MEQDNYLFMQAGNVSYGVQCGIDIHTFATLYELMTRTWTCYIKLINSSYSRIKKSSALMLNCSYILLMVTKTIQLTCIVRLCSSIPNITGNLTGGFSVVTSHTRQSGNRAIKHTKQNFTIARTWRTKNLFQLFLLSLFTTSSRQRNDT